MSVKILVDVELLKRLIESHVAHGIVDLSDAHQLRELRQMIERAEAAR